MLPDYSQGGFYDPSHTYKGMTPGGGPLPGQNSLPYQIWGTNENPQSAFYAKAVSLGYGGTGSRAQAFQGLYGQFQKGYGAAKGKSNFELYFPEYLDQARVNDIFNNMSYEQQGLNPTQYQGRYRWQFRPGG